MGEEKEEVKKEEPKKEESKKKSLSTRTFDFLGRLLKLFENIPKAVAGIAIIISLVAGGTGAWGAYVSPPNKDVKVLKQKVHDLEIWNQALRERSQCWDNNKIEFDGYMLDLDSGDIEKLRK